MKSLNTYALFAEHARDLLSRTGRAGIIVPTGIATDDTTKAFFGDLMSKQALVQIVGFENEDFIFPDVHNEFKFCAFTMAGEGVKLERSDFVFFCRYFEHVHQSARHFELSREDLFLLNPNTRTCPVFRSAADADLTKKIYLRVPVLINEELDQNPWSVSFLRMLDMANDSRLFRTRKQLEGESFVLEGNYFVKNEMAFLPLYEAKMIWQFDHRFASLVGRENGAGRPSRKYEGWYGVIPTNSAEFASPQYWVSSEEVEARLIKRWNKGWLLGFRDVTNSVVERTAIFSLLPRVGINHKTPLILFKGVLTELHIACFLAVMNSLTLDFVTRRKVGGTSLSYFILNQLPVLPPDTFSAEDIAFIVPRVLELVYTAWDMKSFAEDVCNELGEQVAGRRSQITGTNDLDAAAAEALRAEVIRRNAECNADAPDDLFAPRDGFALPPFRWNDERRALIRAELDARIARLYGLTRDELRYILDPMDVYGPDFPGETFRVLKEKEIKQFGEYRTRRLVLEEWDRAGY